MPLILRDVSAWCKCEQMFLLYHNTRGLLILFLPFGSSQTCKGYGSMSRMTKRTTMFLTLFAAVLFVLVGCEQRAPILVYVTPTTLPQIGAVSSPVPADVSPTPIPTIGPLPSATSADASIAALPTDVPTNVPLVVIPTIAANATIVGPVIGPDYTLPPTSTPRPTVAPTEGVAPTEAPDDEDDDGDEVDANVDAAAVATDVRPAGTPLPGLDRSRMGIQLDSNLDENDWRDAVGRRVEEQLHFGWVKVQLPWEDLQPNGPTDFGESFQRFEQYIQYADREGLSILVSVAKAPAWARSNQTEDGPPDDPQVLASFMTFMLTKLPMIDAVEVWNEPNLIREWQGTLPFNGAGYMRLFAPSYQAIKALNPNIRVVTAGLAPTGNSDGSRNDRDYLREMYDNGLAQYADVGVGVHPYGWANPPDSQCCGSRGWDDDPHFFFLDTLRDYRQMMESFGHGSAELWPTEFGWPTWEGLGAEPPEEWMKWISKWDQGNYLIRAFQIGQEQAGIGPMFLWNLNFAMLGNLVQERDERAGFSLLVPLAVNERPAFWMLYDAVRPDEQLERYD